MSMVGLFGLLVAFSACVISLVCFAVSHILYKRDNFEGSATFAWGARLGTVVSFIALTWCLVVLAYCFISGDTSLDYVVRNRSDAQGELAWLYLLAGLWAGRAGSLLFWAWLIALFNAVIVFATRKDIRTIDNAAVAISSLVLIAFVSVLLFSTDNMPFTLLDAKYLNADGSLNEMASLLGMNSLLEHWAMAVHPPTLFIGYAGLTVPFAYAIGALAVDDDSDLWVRRATPYLMFSWLFLGIGIGLGAIWAYVVLGWGGYWGWDPVENASLLPWLIGVALIHSFTIYRKRHAFKRWSVMCACLAFVFVILGTFITRSGLVQSVHAFEGDSVSLSLFLGLIIASMLAGVIGLLLRRKTFGVVKESAEDIESLVSRDTAYYVNNLLMVALSVVIAYLTIAPALPAGFPFGGQAVSAGTYNAIARPLGIVYCALIAVCPLLGWKRTSGKAFGRKALVPGLCAAGLFAILLSYFVMYLLPSYEAIINAGGSQAVGLLEQGSPLYYNVLAVVGFAVASLLFFNALFMVIRSFSASTSAAEGNEHTPGIRTRFAAIGGGICHLAMGVILVGLIGSSMYVTEITGYMKYDKETDTCAEPFVIQDFELTYTGNSITEIDEGSQVDYRLTFDVTKGGDAVGEVSPAVELVTTTQQQKLEASVLSFPTEDLFVVYRGVDDAGNFSMDVRVNPLISFVWIGFALLMGGSVLSLFAHRKN